jgi:hypothetical protein
MKSVLLSAAALAALLVVSGATGASAATVYPGGSVGVDISYPSCHTKIKPGLPFGVVGVSGGRVYEDNPCAASEAAAFPGGATLYVNTGLYTGGNYFAAAMTTGDCGSKATAAEAATCGAYEYGLLAGQHAVDYARSQHLSTAVWWLDVETTNTWDADTALNVQSIKGEYDAIRAADAAATIGVYAVPSQWNQIVGSSFPTTWTWPVWYATGLRSASAGAVRTYCGSQYSFTGGPVLLVQWVEKLDQDYACP